QSALDELDAPTSKRLGSIGTADTQRLARKVRRLADEIPESGPDRHRARVQFICDLASIYYRLTGKLPGRWVLRGSSNTFPDLVIAALTPIDSWHNEFIASELKRNPPEKPDDLRIELKKASVLQGCDADIKAAVKTLQWIRSIKKSLLVSNR